MAFIFDESEETWSSSKSLLGNIPNKQKLIKYESITSDTCKPNKGTTWWMSVFLMMNVMFTGGILNIAAVYNTGGGIAVVLPLQFVIIPVFIGSVFILSWCSDLNKSASYEEVVLAVCGKRAQMVCAAALMVSAFASLVGTFVVVGDQWDKFLTYVYGPTYCQYWYMRRSFTIATTCTLIALPLSFGKRFDFLKYPSVVGVGAIWYVVLLVTFKYIIYGPQNVEATEHLGRSWTDGLNAVPVLCFCYQCHLGIIPIYSCFEKRNLQELSKTVFLGFVVVMLGYTSIAVFGFVTFGYSINQDILLSYKPITVDILIALILIAFKMYVGQPILIFVGRAAASNIWLYFKRISAIDAQRYERKRRVIISTSWFLCAITIATLMPNVGVVLQFLGGFNAAFTCIIPGICLMRVVLTERLKVTSVAYYRLLLVVAVFYMCLGTFLFGLGITQVGFRSLAHFTSQPPPRTVCP